MFRKFGLFICLGFVCLSLCGCVPILAGAAGGAGTGLWLSGKLTQEVDASLEKALEASESGLKALDLDITKETVKSDVAQLIGTYTDGRTIWVDVHSITQKRSKIGVRVGAASDKEAARQVLDKILLYLQ
ncbi:MAG: DUF3568 family protein [Candidatus Omnitrophica bacterium]|nr:DUF3568 family protein [Candidatus Omnitrophota bacterium]